MKSTTSIFITLWGSCTMLVAQDLDSIVNSIRPEAKPGYVLSTFKSTRVVIGQSVETPVEKDLTFIISHRFGNIKGGFYDFFGLDQAYNRLGFEYGINDRIGVAIGRQSFERIYDGSAKVRILWQQTGQRQIPVSLTWYSGMFVNSTRWTESEQGLPFSARMSYINQLIVARKFGKLVSLQLTPSYLHRNLVPESEENALFALGMSGKVQFARKVSFNAEYFWRINDSSDDKVNNLSFGFDFETGGHVFQLNVSNSYGSSEDYFIAQPNGAWKDGDVFLGFNIYRVFPLSEKRKNIY